MDYLNELHPGWYYVDSGCMLLPADPAEQQARIDAQVEMRAARKPEVVRLDWEWQEPSAADAAAAEAVDDQPAYYCEKLRADSKVWYVTPVHPLEPEGAREDYTWAWDSYAINTFKLNGYLGGCETGTMKQVVLARATRMLDHQGDRRSRDSRGGLEVCPTRRLTPGFEQTSTAERPRQLNVPARPHPKCRTPQLQSTRAPRLFRPSGRLITMEE